ncbi:MAG TPA: 2-oxoglutarate dehydrogenase E1 component [Algoriphagus sp.]|jgi:2-oxoglutarate dehydrogenase E1 component|uniref:2-oxoglutarate dehydrogenase E1 component n=1 Tax=Algoriphagus sp. UBA3586 TaxID=1945999 RepID=UPI000ED4200C|nr:2-oxoglutarate dehydrogenase E1 component [Algoriphagus sp. UBA3586]HCB46274.1 2-oxoglutarate dehydrogenase E1 component [Algoriphagus sp.]|tara:strand:+ start:11246 stop:14032 length:2787 start_codon:yes stop_codon:yes gene_type:complete
MDKFSYIANAHVSYIDELYNSYKQDPESIDPSWKEFFDGFDFALTNYGEGENGQAAESTASTPKNGSLATPGTIMDMEQLPKEIKVRALIHAHRSRAHLRSKTNPVRERRDRKALIDPDDFGLGQDDMNTEFQAGNEIGIGKSKLSSIIDALKTIYEGPMGFEYLYIRDPEMLDWFKTKVEKEALAFNPSTDEKKRILFKLNQAVVFENFLHTKYLGQKRFSLEGGESTIPFLDAVINTAALGGVEEVMIGMAHRGRLNVLANVMGKTYEQIFSEFEGTAKPDLTMGDGDVKYHMGYSSDIVTPEDKKVHLKLAPNPSHLEAVNPVVEGFIRAKIDSEHKGDKTKALPILIHGDAAVAGQGIVYEVTQMAGLKGYNTGGTIHFVINNQVGFTTDFDDARSSIYCTDVAKIIDAPVIHVNGDNAEAVVFAAKLAAEFRQKFGRDIFVDMVCYRRHGHNESDEPKFTQPELYNIISKHPNPREIYVKRLTERGDIDAEIASQMDEEFRQLLQDRLNMVKEKPLPYQATKFEREWGSLRRSKPEDFDQSPETGVDAKVIDHVAEALTTIPKGFKPIKQIEAQMKQRKDMFFKSKSLNWASAELLAYGSLLLEGKTVRLTGQDVQRGTFSHRHAVLHDANSNQPFNSLKEMKDRKGQFHIYNSLLSEYAVLGFEYGYGMANPHSLTIWEAQFGDFANGAQTMIDQFISSGESKWQKQNGLVMLLPHGYEGQGPEHSNARPERFLQLSAEYNMVVANITEPSNFFHLLRRQLAWEFRKPCVVMSPKSLLRHPKVMSPIDEFTSGKFRELIPDTTVNTKDVKRVVLCTGKVYYDLEEAREKEKVKNVALVRIEQLHPLPKKQIFETLKQYKDAEVVWVQEEPENMGYWNYMLRLLHKELPMDVIARKMSASPATGYNKVHVEEQKAIVSKALKL